jgi:hypothetical protein
MTSRSIATFLALALPLSAPGAARAGLVLKASGREGQPTQLELEGKRLRTESAGEAERIMLFDGEAQRMILLDPVRKTSRTMDEATARQTGDRLGQQLAKLPPEARRRLQAAAGQGTPAGASSRHRWSLEAAGGSTTVAGRPCRFYRLVRDGKVDEAGRHHDELCLIPWGGDLRREDFASWTALGTFFERLTAAMTSGLGGGAAPGHPGERFFGAWFQDAPGFPGQTVEVDASGKRTVDWELTSIERRSLPADRFAVPGGYREVAPEE